MKRLAIVAALVAIGVAVPLSIGSSHREAPLTSIDPTADDTDVYAFTAKDAPDALTVVANWIPFEDPAGGPNFYRFDDRGALLHQRRQHRRRQVRRPLPVQVPDKYENAGLVPVRAAGVTSIDDPKLLQKQFYDVERLSYGTRRARRPRRRGKKHSRKGKSRKHKSQAPQAREARAAQRAHDRAQHPGRAEQRRAEDDPELRRGRQPGDHRAAGRRQGVRRPA